jgi:hypothetical protein
LKTISWIAQLLPLQAGENSTQDWKGLPGLAGFGDTNTPASASDSVTIAVEFVTPGERLSWGDRYSKNLGQSVRVLRVCKVGMVGKIYVF